MHSLFPLEPVLPEGFRYFPDFISEDEEEGLLDVIRKQQLHAFIFQGFEAKRRVASFGFDYSFDKKQLTEGKPIPPEFHPLIDKVAKKIGKEREEFAELLIIEYPEKAVMNWHRDAPPFGMIAGISLLSDCVFRFRPHEKTRQVRGSVISFPVQKRSLYIMDGPARMQWQHSVAAVDHVRYSITLRTLKA